MMRTKLILIILSVAVLVLAALFFVSPPGLIKSGGEKKLFPRISWDDDDVRAGESVNFTLSGVPEGSNVTWTFSDISWNSGNFTMYGIRVNVVFVFSAVYRVEAVVREGEKEGRDSAEVSVKNPDEKGTFDMSIGTWERVGGVYQAEGSGVLLGPSITYPEIYLVISLQRVTGVVTGNVTISHQNEVLYTGESSETAVRGSVELRFHATPEDLAGDRAEEGYGQEGLDMNIILTGAGVADSVVSIYIELYY